MHYFLYWNSYYTVLYLLSCRWRSGGERGCTVSLTSWRNLIRGEFSLFVKIEVRTSHKFEKLNVVADLFNPHLSVHSTSTLLEDEVMYQQTFYIFPKTSQLKTNVFITRNL